MKFGSKFGCFEIIGLKTKLNSQEIPDAFQLLMISSNFSDKKKNAETTIHFWAKTHPRQIPRSKLLTNYESDSTNKFLDRVTPYYARKLLGTSTQTEGKQKITSHSTFKNKKNSFQFFKNSKIPKIPKSKPISYHSIT